jgi:zinc transport system substrate-binding protein
LIAGRWSSVRFRPSRAAPFGIAIAGGLVVVCGANSGSAGGGSPEPLQDRIKVATTIYPVEYFVGRVGGERVDVVSLIPPGMEAHDFEPRVSDLIDIARADLLVYNGAEFEPWVERALDALGGDAPPAIESVELLRADLLAAEKREGGNDRSEDEFDPHVWLSPLKAMAQVEAIVDALAAIRPDLATEFRSGGNALTSQLEDLDASFRSELSACGLSTFVTSHAAYGHLANEYGLEQVAVAGLSPDAEPGPRTLANIANRMSDLGVSHVLIEPIANSRVGENLARETGGTTLPLHPLESLTEEEQNGGADYFSIMNQNLESLVMALDCN